MKSRFSIGPVTLGVLVALVCGPPQALGAEAWLGPDSVAETRLKSTGVAWIPKVKYESILLTVSCPNEEVFRADFAYPAKPAFNMLQHDGSYVYELTVTPPVDPGTREAMAGARASGDATFARDLRAAGMMPKGAIQAGQFRVIDGRIATGDEEEEDAR